MIKRFTKSEIREMRKDNKAHGKKRGENLNKERGNPWNKAEVDTRCIYCGRGVHKHEYGHWFIKEGFCCRECYLLNIDTNRGKHMKAYEGVRDMKVRRYKSGLRY